MTETEKDHLLTDKRVGKIATRKPMTVAVGMTVEISRKSNAFGQRLKCICFTF